MSNSSIMSYGPLAPNYTISAPAGLAICALYQNTTDTPNYPVSYVLPNSTVNITFGGSPPYNVTTSFLPFNGISTCGANKFTLNSSSFLWTVGDHNATFGKTYSYGDAFVLYAMETTNQTSPGQYWIYPSNYFVVSNNTNSSGGNPAASNPTTKSGASSTGVSWKGASLAVALGIAVLSIL